MIGTPESLLFYPRIAKAEKRRAGLPFTGCSSLLKEGMRWLNYWQYRMGSTFQPDRSAAHTGS
jgi:hypothetical protein